MCVPEVAAVVIVNGAGEVLIAGLRQLRFFVEQAEDAVGLGLDQIDAVLIVHEADVLDAQSLLPIKLLR